MDDRNRMIATRLMLEAFEIESLNIDNLNVEELERRLELSTGVPITTGWLCDCDNYCNHCVTYCPCNGTNTCTTYCGGDCSTYCGADCETDCSPNVVLE